MPTIKNTIIVSLHELVFQSNPPPSHYPPSFHEPNDTISPSPQNSSKIPLQDKYTIQ